MTLKLYNTASRSLQDFEPINPDRVTMYVCGPTVYAPAHVGNFRPEVVFDVLFRVLRHIYGDDHVLSSRNFTDVDDKINQAAIKEGVEISVITKRFTDIYHEDARALNVLDKSFEPTATGSMEDIVAFIERLVADGHAYEAEGHVLFSIKSYDQYGAFSRRSLDEMIDGARVEVAPYKRDAADFVLWKPSKEGEPSWESPFGPGRPGWHIECSAMIEKSLGKTIDIHAGGIDLVFPHHENEIAQSVCAHDGAPLANYWLHNGFLSMATEKMSKSDGNVVTVHEMLAKGLKGEVIRYGLLSGQYRAPLDWTDKLLAQSRKSLDRLYGVLRRLADIKVEPVVPNSVLDVLSDDLNTPKALALLFEIAGRANKADSDSERAQAKAELFGAGQLLGLFSEDPDHWFGLESLSDDERKEIDDLITQRNEARANKDWEAADALREELDAKRVQVDDGPEGSTWRMVINSQTASLVRALDLLKSDDYVLEYPETSYPNHIERIASKDGLNHPVILSLNSASNSNLEQPVFLAGEFKFDGIFVVVRKIELIEKLRESTIHKDVYGLIVVETAEDGVYLRS